MTSLSKTWRSAAQKNLKKDASLGEKTSEKQNKWFAWKENTASDTRGIWEFRVSISVENSPTKSES